MSKDENELFALDLQLSDEEIYLVGMIVAHWGALEHEIFVQTMSSFGEHGDLPKNFNNLQFTETLRLWKERVLEVATGGRHRALTRSLEEIEKLKGPRDALAHGMWHWSPTSPDVISTVRVKKRGVITSTFDTETLRKIAFDLARLNFRLRYPGGAHDVAAERADAGLYISRKGFEILSGKRKPHENK